MTGRRVWSSAAGLAVSLTVVAAATTVFRLWLHLSNPTIAALIYLLIILVAATVSTVWVAIVTSLLGVLCLNFFFMPPVGTFSIAEGANRRHEEEVEAEDAEQRRHNGHPDGRHRRGDEDDQQIDERRDRRVAQMQPQTEDRSRRRDNRQRHRESRRARPHAPARHFSA